nr:MAG TPA: hypothetical protein [Caudoviricetes sp.]
MGHKESLPLFFDKPLIVFGEISKAALYSLLNMKIQVSIKLSLFFFWNIDYLKLNLEASIFILSSVLISEEFIDYSFFCSPINIVRYSNLFTVYKTKSQSIAFRFIQIARAILID